MRLITCLTLAVLCACSQETQGKMNEGSRVTATDQGENGADLAITKGIRQGLVGTADFSTSAKNVTVVSKDGVVTLRGSVPSADEKNRIESIAHDVAGVRRVDSQLTIQ